jgi:UDP-N-acetylglucosamine:LPS N-acetylglucosamine transferase
LSSVALVETVLSLLEDRERLRRMGAAARKLSHPSAAIDIARMAASLAGITQAAETRN